MLALLAGGPALQTRADEQGHEAHAEHFAACAKACSKCMHECGACAHHCAHLVAQGKKDHLTTLGTCTDCAEFCSAAAKVTSHHGPMAALCCEACAKACDVCGKACEKHGEDEHMKQCAQECRDCAKACREMMQHVGHNREASGR